MNMRSLFLCVLFFSNVTVLHARGVVEVHLRSYHHKDGLDMSGYCCDHIGTSSNCGDCDPYFVVCLVLKATPRSCISNQVTTDNFNNTNQITFTDQIQNVTNPLTLSFSQFSSSFTLNISVFDDDRFDTRHPTSNDKLVDLAFDIGQGEPSSFSAQSVPFTQKTITSSHIDMEFGYRIQCDVYYYGETCDVYCRPVPTKSCTSQGQHKCMPGWHGPNCDKKETTTTRITTLKSTLKSTPTLTSMSTRKRTTEKSTTKATTPRLRTATTTIKSTTTKSTTIPTSTIKSTTRTMLIIKPPTRRSTIHMIKATPSASPVTSRRKGKLPMYLGIIADVIVGVGLLGGGILVLVKCVPRNKVHGEGRKTDIVEPL